MNTILKWLLHHLMFAGTMFFAAAPVSVEAAGGNDDEATNDASNDNLDAGTSGHDLQNVDPADEKSVPAPAADGKPEQLDGRKLPQKVRETLEALKATDPKAHTWLKDILFADRAFRQEFPGGIAEAKKAKEELATIKADFPDGFDSVKQEIAEWQGIDQAWNNSDPKVIDIWHDSNPQAFAKLMPTAMNKFAQSSPEAYQKHMASVMVSTFQSAGLNHNLSFLNRLIAAGDKEGATQLLKEVTDWIGQIDGIAKQEIKAPETKQPDGRQQELDERESKIFANETAGQVNPYRHTLIRKEATQYLPKGTELDEETFEAIDAQVQRNMDKLLTSDPTFIKTFSQYAEAKDATGLVAFMKQKLQDLMPSQPGKPGPVEKAVKLFFRGATPKPKPAPQNGKPAPAAQPVAGWEKVAKAPSDRDIDYKKSPWEMRYDKQAILTNGKKVYWGDKIPA